MDAYISYHKFCKEYGLKPSQFNALRLFFQNKQA